MSADGINNTTQDALAAAEAPIDLSDAQIDGWIRTSRSRGAGVWRRRRWVLLVVMIAAFALMVTAGREAPPARQLAPVVMMAGVLCASWWFSRQLRRSRRLYTETLSQMQMRQWPAAAAAMSRLMGDPIDSPDMRSVVLLWLAELATRAGRHDAAVAALDEVLEVDVSGQYRQSAMAEKALALLRAQRLTDATTLLDNLRTMDLIEPVASLVEVGQLYRRIRTRNFASIITDADALARRARAVFHRQAAYVYGLIALALEQAGHAGPAQAYYDCATRLMSPAELERRFSELGPLSERLVPARSPL